MGEARVARAVLSKDGANTPVRGHPSFRRDFWFYRELRRLSEDTKWPDTVLLGHSVTRRVEVARQNVPDGVRQLESAEARDEIAGRREKAPPARHTSVRTTSTSPDHHN